MFFQFYSAVVVLLAIVLFVMRLNNEFRRGYFVGNREKELYTEPVAF